MDQRSHRAARGSAQERRQRGRRSSSSRRCVAEPQHRFPVCAVRAGSRPPGHSRVSTSPISRPGGRCSSTVPAKWQAVATASRCRVRRSPTTPDATGNSRASLIASPRPSRCRPTCFRSSSATSRSRPRERDGRTFRMFHRETDADKVDAESRDAIFDLHARALAYHGAIHGHPVRVRQVRLRADSRVPVRRAWSMPARFSITRRA